MTGADDIFPAKTGGVGITNGTLTARIVARRRMDAFPNDGFRLYK
jgi:hypothetical protein